MVIGAECLSKVTEYKDRNTCILFGDGAGAVVIQACEEEGILESILGADGFKGDKLTILGLRQDEEEKLKRPFGNYNTVWMNGSEVFKFAVNAMVNSVNDLLKKIKKTIGEISLIVPHQANQRILDGAIKRFGCSKDKVFTNVKKYGNMSAASIPIALYEAIKEKKIKKGDLIILTGFGGGLTYGSIALRV